MRRSRSVSKYDMKELRRLEGAARDLFHQIRELKKKEAKLCLDLGRTLIPIFAAKLWKKDGFRDKEGRDSWFSSRMGFNHEQARRYKAVALKFTEEQLADRALGIENLTEIGKAPAELVPALLEHGDGQQVQAVQRGIKAGKYKLQKGGTAEEAREQVRLGILDQMTEIRADGKEGPTPEQQARRVTGKLSELTQQLKAGQALEKAAAEELKRACCDMLRALGVVVQERTITREQEAVPGGKDDSEAPSAIPLVDDGREYTPLPLEFEDDDEEDEQEEAQAQSTAAEEEAAALASYTPEQREVFLRMKERTARFMAEQAALTAQNLQGPVPSLVVHRVCCAPALPKQIGLLGHLSNGESVYHDVYRPTATAIFGPPGEGKSWTAGVFVENFTMSVPGVNNLKARFCAIALHYFPSSAYPSELLTAVWPAWEADQLARLEKLGVDPLGHPDVLVLTLSALVREMRPRQPHAQVHGIKFGFRELNQQCLRIILGLNRKQSPLYAQEVSKLLREFLTRDWGRPPTYQDLCDLAASFPFSPGIAALVMRRLELGRQWIDDSRSMHDFVKPGRLIIIELCTEWLTEEEAEMLFALCTEVLVIRSGSGNAPRMPIYMLYDEAHVFAGMPMVCKQMDLILRQRRHLLTSITIASQDPPSVPGVFLPLMDGVGVFAHQSEEWNKYIAKKIRAFGELSVDDYQELSPGQAWWWSRKWTDCRAEGPAEAEVAVADEHAQEGHGPHNCEQCRMAMEEEDPDLDDEDDDDEEEYDAADDPDVFDGNSVVKLEVRQRVTWHGGDTLTADSDEDEDEDEDDEEG